VAHDVRIVNAPLTSEDHVVVVGAGLAGWRLCEGVRREGFVGAITLIGAEPHRPYDRPPLSKQVLSGKWPADHAFLSPPDAPSDLGVDVALGVPARDLDVERCAVTLGDDTVIAGTRLVIATGTRARHLPLTAERGVFTLRTMDDVARLSDAAAALPAEATVVVIGAGFIGAEVATSLRTRGLSPIVLEAMANPLLNVVGDEAADWLRGVPDAADIELRTSQEVTDVVEVDNGLEVRFADGSTLATAIVVVGIGAVPNTEWLESSALEVRNGVVVSDSLLATPSIGAVGDVARFAWRHGPFVDDVRIEHWQVAIDHAAAMAATLVHGADATGPIDMVPYFWSDQYGKKIQMLGHPAPTDDVVRVVHDDSRWLAIYARDGVVTGLLGLSHPRALMLSRPLVEGHVRLTEALAAAPWAS
jgi:3-phenylpropionate/trans-cinnamate dioxygenase ferredoxin reductase component